MIVIGIVVTTLVGVALWFSKKEKKPCSCMDVQSSLQSKSNRIASTGNGEILDTMKAMLLNKGTKENVCGC
ncbi:hypothetical protein FQ019_15920 [Flagellimonas aequoris]|nr:hypothetical protein FQ019_15920 [Allomuricauda aequoris]